MKKTKFLAILAIVSVCLTGWIVEIRAMQEETDRTLTSDARPNDVPSGYSSANGVLYPSVPAPESESVRPYTLPPHRFLQGSENHPNPPVTDQSFTVDEKNKTIQMAGAHKLPAFKDWAEERYFDVKFASLDKRFAAIEEKQAEIDKRLRAIEERKR